MPRFSVVVPMTRPHYIDGVVRSILAQTFEDFEVVISDNSPGGWREGTALRDPRIRIVRPQGYLTVRKHWDFALGHASGDWQLMVCDDDALVPQALESIDRAARAFPGIQSIRWRHAAYTHDGEDAGVVARPACSGSAQRLASARVLAEMFDAGSIPGAIKDRSPNMPMAACSRELLERIRRTAGSIFPSMEPMTSMSMLALALADDVLILDLPLTVLGASADSATGSMRSSGSGETIFEKTNADVRITHLPVRSLRILPAWKTETMLELQELFPQHFGRYQLNWAGFFCHCRRAIEEMRSRGWDVSPEEQMFASAMRAQPQAVQRAVRARMRKENVRRALSRLRQKIALAARGLLRPASRRKAADKARFTSIDAAAAHVGALNGTGSQPDRA